MHSGVQIALNRRPHKYPLNYGDPRWLHACVCSFVCWWIRNSNPIDKTGKLKIYYSSLNTKHRQCDFYKFNEIKVLMSLLSVESAPRQKTKRLLRIIKCIFMAPLFMKPSRRINGKKHLYNSFFSLLTFYIFCLLFSYLRTYILLDVCLI